MLFLKFYFVCFLIFSAHSPYLCWTGANLATLKSQPSDKHLLDDCLQPPSPQPFHLLFSPLQLLTTCLRYCSACSRGATWCWETRPSLCWLCQRGRRPCTADAAWLMNETWDGSFLCSGPTDDVQRPVNCYQVHRPDSSTTSASCSVVTLEPVSSLRSAIAQGRNMSKPKRAAKTLQVPMILVLLHSLQRGFPQEVEAYSWVLYSIMSPALVFHFHWPGSWWGATSFPGSAVFTAQLVF